MNGENKLVKLINNKKKKLKINLQRKSKEK